MRWCLYIFLAYVFTSCGPSIPETKEGQFLFHNYSEIPFVEATCRPLPEIEYNLDSIQGHLKDVYKGQKEKELFQRVEDLRSAPELNFPFKPYDYAVLLMLNKTITPPLKPEDIHDISFICDQKMIRLLKVLNNPLNYQEAPCSSEGEHTIIRFHKGDEIVAEIGFSCLYKGVRFSPSNPMSLKTLNARGDSLLKIIRFWQ